MDSWNVLGVLLLGTGVGALTTALVQAKQIRKLKELLKAAQNNSHTPEQGHKSDGTQIRLRKARSWLVTLSCCWKKRRRAQENLFD